MSVRELWVAAFLVVVFAPVVLRLFTPERQGLWQEMVTLTGLLAVSLMVCTVVLPARVRSLTRTFGIEAVLGSHRVLGTATAVVVLVHLAAVLLADPRLIALVVPLLDPREPAQTIAAVPLLNPLLTPPARALFAGLATYCLVALVLLSAGKRRRYEVWRRWHVALTAGVLAGTAGHALLIGHLIPTAALIGWLTGDPIGLVMTTSALAWDPSGAVFLALSGLIVAVVGLRRWLVRPLRRRGRYRVDRIDDITPTVSTLVLRPDRRTHRDPLRFAPGQFAWLRLKRDVFTEEHPFTITSAAGNAAGVEFTIRHRGDWTTGPLRRLRAGDFVWLDGPHGALTPDAETTGMVLIAGGVGIAPMMSILRTAAAEDDYRGFRLLLLDRPGETLFRHELIELQDVLALDIHELGGALLTADLLAGLLPPAPLRGQQDYYLCGSPSLVTDALAVLGELGIPAARVHTEQFNA